MASDEEQPIPEGTVCVYCQRRPATVRGNMTFESTGDCFDMTGVAVWGPIAVDLFVCRGCCLALVTGKDPPE